MTAPNHLPLLVANRIANLSSAVARNALFALCNDGPILQNVVLDTIDKIEQNKTIELNRTTAAKAVHTSEIITADKLGGFQPLCRGRRKKLLPEHGPKAEASSGDANRNKQKSISANKEFVPTGSSKKSGRGNKTSGQQHTTQNLEAAGLETLLLPVNMQQQLNAERKIDINKLWGETPHAGSDPSMNPDRLSSEEGKETCDGSASSFQPVGPHSVEPCTSRDDVILLTCNKCEALFLKSAESAKNECWTHETGAVLKPTHVQDVHLAQCGGSLERLLYQKLELFTWSCCEQNAAKTGGCVPAGVHVGVVV